MSLTSMRYKDFVWPHNPRTYTIRYERQVAVHKVPFGRYAMQDLGMGRRIMEGEGEFWGPDAYDTFKELASVFYAGGPGTLVHPVWQSASAYLVRLELVQEPRPDYVRYAFTFWEDFGGYRQGLRVSPGGGGAMATLTVSAPGARRASRTFGALKLYSMPPVMVKRCTSLIGTSAGRSEPSRCMTDMFSGANDGMYLSTLS